MFLNFVLFIFFVNYIGLKLFFFDFYFIAFFVCYSTFFAYKSNYYRQS
jgi:hypothetical protein